MRARWQRINEAQRRGKGMPPIKVFRVGGLHFVEDGHHRVSVARHLGLEVIEAYVTEIVTRVCAERGPAAQRPARRRATSGSSSSGFRSTREERKRIELTADPEHDYGELAEAVEAWGFRLIQGLGEPRRPPRDRRGLVPRRVRPGSRGPARGRA